MMRYRVKGGILPMEERDWPGEGEMTVEIVTTQEFEGRCEKDVHKRLLQRGMQHIQYCKADILKDCIIGTFLIPKKENLIGRGDAFGFYLTKEKLVFVDDHNVTAPLIEQMKETVVLEHERIAQFFFEFMETLVHDDIIFLQQYEKKLAELEGVLLDRTTEDFDKKLLHVRKELLNLQSYYEQMIDISETLEENPNHLFEEEDSRLFGRYSKRVDRLFDNTRTLQEYSVQLRELYESQIAMRQNQIMKVLTVVTTIFMPLTLIAGWYGMNFVNMPELRSPNGYGVVAIISICIILVEVWLFKIKNWFK